MDRMLIFSIVMAFIILGSEMLQMVVKKEYLRLMSVIPAVLLVLLSSRLLKDIFWIDISLRLVGGGVLVWYFFHFYLRKSRSGVKSELSVEETADSETDSGEEA